MIRRRGLISVFAGLIAAPALVRAEGLMPLSRQPAVRAGGEIKLFGFDAQGFLVNDALRVTWIGPDAGFEPMKYVITGVSATALTVEARQRPRRKPRPRFTPRFIA